MTLHIDGNDFPFQLLHSKQNHISFGGISQMAKTRKRSTDKDKSQNEPELHDEAAEQATDTAVAVEAPPAPREKPSEPASTGGQGNTGEDVASLDAETNARYEQVKGGKLYIKDLQQMDVQALHEI